MAAKVADAELRRLRNEISISWIIQHLEIPSKLRDGCLRFLCPLCSEFHSAVDPKTNLARCFRCERNFNPIDFVMVVDKVTFLDAVATLRPLVSRSSPSALHPNIMNALNLIEQAQGLVGQAGQQLCSVKTYVDEWEATGDLYHTIKQHWHRIDQRRGSLDDPQTP